MLDSLLRKMSPGVFFCTMGLVFLNLDTLLCAIARSYGVGMVGMLLLTMAFNVGLYVPLRWRHMELTEPQEDFE